MQSDGNARSGVIAVIAALICLGFYLLARRSDSTSSSGSSPSEQESDRGAPSRAHLAWMDQQFEHDRSELLRYSAMPEFAEYRAELLALLNDAQKLYQHAHTRYAAALQTGDHDEAFRYAVILDSAGTGPETVTFVLGRLDQQPADAQMARDTQEIMDRVQKVHTKCVGILAQYSHDSESVKKYQENPAELDSLLRSGYVRIEQTQGLVEKNDVLRAWLSAVHANLLVSDVWERLLGFQAQRYQSRTTGRPYRHGEAFSGYLKSKFTSRSSERTTLANST
jgi:hypothetical protein